MEERKLNLFGTTYRVREVDTIVNEENGHNLYDLCNFTNHIIEVAKKIDNKKVTDREQRISLLHELFHAFLKEGQYMSCSDDEPLVEWLARCLNAAIEQKIIKI